MSRLRQFSIRLFSYVVRVAFVTILLILQSQLFGRYPHSGGINSSLLEIRFLESNRDN